jgi:ketopantoate reductase
LGRQFAYDLLSMVSQLDAATLQRELGRLVEVEIVYQRGVPPQATYTLQDVEQGKRLEVEETLGYAVRQGAALGIPTPTIEVCYNLIAGINHYLQ